MISWTRRSALSRPRSRPSRRNVRVPVAQTSTLPARRGEASGKKKTTCGAPEIHSPCTPGATSTHSTFEVTNFFRNSGAPNSERSTGPRTSVETMPSRSYSVPCTAGRNGPPRTLRAPASSTGLPRPAASGSSCARGSVPTRSTVTPRRWKKRRMALRDCGTAKAATRATTASATATTSARRRRGRSSSREATSGVGGHATVGPRDRRSRSRSVIALPQSLERARSTRLDRAAAHAERSGGLGLRQVEQVAAAEHQPRVVGKALERAEQAPALVGREHFCLGGRGRAPRDVFALGPQREGGAAPRRATAVARLVGDDAQEPRPERRAGAEATERAPRLEHAVLDGVLGLVARNEVRDSV